jgi:hypothetical protein
VNDFFRIKLKYVLVKLFINQEAKIFITLKLRGRIICSDYQIWYNHVGVKSRNGFEASQGY